MTCRYHYVIPDYSYIVKNSISRVKAVLITHGLRGHRWVHFLLKQPCPICWTLPWHVRETQRRRPLAQRQTLIAIMPLAFKNLKATFWCLYSRRTIIIPLLLRKIVCTGDWFDLTQLNRVAPWPLVESVLISCLTQPWKYPAQLRKVVGGPSSIIQGIDIIFINILSQQATWSCC